MRKFTSVWIADLSINVTHIRNCTERIHFVSTSKVSRLQTGTPLWFRNPPLNVKREILNVLDSVVLIFSLWANTQRRGTLFIYERLPRAIIFRSIVTRIPEEFASYSGIIGRKHLIRLRYYWSKFLSMLSISFYAIPWHRISGRGGLWMSS